MKLKTLRSIVVSLLLACIFLSCKKEMKPSLLSKTGNSELNGKDGANGHLKQTKTFSSDVVKEWLETQMSLLYSPVVSYGVNAGRYMAYSGIALYEATVPGMPAYQSLSGQLNEMPLMPQTEPGKAYHWPTCANAALAEMTRKLFTFTPATNDAVQKLEDSLNGAYQTQIGDTAIFQRSKTFGKAVAEKILAWSTADHPWSSLPPLVLTNNSPG